MTETVKTVYDNDWTIEAEIGDGPLAITIKDPNDQDLDSVEFHPDSWKRPRGRTQIKNFIAETMGIFRGDYDTILPICEANGSGEVEVDLKKFKTFMSKIRESIETEETVGVTEETGEESVAEMEDEFKKSKAEEWLKSPSLISKVDKVLHHHLAGETKNALLLWLVYMSSFTDSPVVIRPTGESSTGKSFLVVQTAKPIPEDMKIIRKGFSKMAPWNKGVDIEGENRKVWNVDNKIIVLLEEETSEEFLQQFRPILSRDQDKVTYEVTNTDSDSRETLKVDIVGHPVYVGIQVGEQMDEQEETRAMKMTPNAGAEKYDAAVGWDANKDSHPWRGKRAEEDTETLKKAVSLLDSYYVLIPYLNVIKRDFPTNRGRHMRDWRHFKGLIKAVTIMHQYKRPVLEVDGREYLVSAPVDLEVTLSISRHALSETLKGLGSREQKFWKAMDNYESVEGWKGIMKVYEDCFGERRSRNTIRNKYIDKFFDNGIIEVVEEGSGPNPNKYATTGSLSSLSSNLEDIVESAFNCDFEETSLVDLLSFREVAQGGIHLSNLKPLGMDNPIEDPDEEKMEEVWDTLARTTSAIDNNRSVLERTKEEDYKRVGSKSETDDNDDNNEVFDKLEEDLGDSNEKALKPMKEQVLSEVEFGPQTPDEVADELDLDLDRAKELLGTLFDEDEVKKKAGEGEGEFVYSTVE